MNDLTKEEKVTNIIAFLAIVFGENSAVWDEVMSYDPEYLVEKFDAHIQSLRALNRRHIHQLLIERRIKPYFNKYKLELNTDE